MVESVFMQKVKIIMLMALLLQGIFVSAAHAIGVGGSGFQ